MNYKIYHNCLRVQVTPDNMQDERIESIVNHCVKYGFDNVMLCINQEEFSVGHIPLEMAKPWIAVLKKAAAALRAKGISVSLNNWIEIGHCDSGFHWHDGQNFTAYVDMKGQVAQSTICPLCDTWFAYFAEYAAYLVREINPDTFWVEDDFRLHNHAPLFGIGCYCEKHMAMYNERLGTQYSREEFLAKVFAKGGINRERQVWLDVNRDTMLLLADKLGKTLKAVKPDIDVALMTSFPDTHCMEARDWERLLDNLSQGGKHINRIHLPYNEMPPKEFLYEFNTQSMGIRALTGKDVIIMPEIEHGSATLYDKTPRYLQFTLEASLPLVISGSTYSIYGFHANGARDSFGFGEVVRKLQPYMQGVCDLNLDFSRMQGVVVPVSEKACYYKTVEKDYTDLAPTEYCAAGYLSLLGISYRYSQEKHFTGQTVFMTGSNADLFTDDELKDLFADNFVIADATFAKALEARGLLSLICATGISDISYSNGDYSYEECADEQTVICGMRKLRASGRASCLPPCIRIHYTDDAKVLTTINKHTMQVVSAGIVSGKNFLMLPFAVNENNYGMYDELRRHFLIEAVAKQNNTYTIGNAIGVCPYLYARENDWVLILVNGNVDVMEQPTLQIGNIPFETVKKLNRDGKLVDCSFTRSQNTITLDDTLDYMSSSVYILK